MKTMKIEKSNNPAAVGALALVLALIVGRILWMMFGHGATVAAASTVAAAPSPITAASTTPGAPAAPAARTMPVAAGTPAPETYPVSSAVTPVTTRNPFSVTVRPTPAMPRAFGGPQTPAAHRAATGPTAMSLMPLPPLPVRVSESRLGAGALRPAAARGLDALPPHQSAAKGQTESVPTLKLTAIVAGTERLAVVQTTSAEPVILRVGDTIDGMRLLAIHEQDVVFARGNGSWTLPLQSAADSAGGLVSVTSVATPEETTHESQ